MIEIRNVTDEHEQQYKTFYHCVSNRDKPEKWLSFRKLDDGWTLIQYDPQYMLEYLAPDTPVWAIWSPGGTEAHCIVVYGDPHIVYAEQGQLMVKKVDQQKQKLDEVDFKTVAQFTLANEDVLFFVGAEAANGNLSEVYVRSKSKGSVFVWGKSDVPSKTPEVVAKIDEQGLTFNV